MTSKSVYSYCFVPQCLNTSKSTPNKLFFHVPKNKSDRSKWCKAVRRFDFSSHQSPRTCCEDHFKLEEDVDQWARYKILKSAGQPLFRLRLKKNVIPHIFDCQGNRQTAHSKPKRSLILKNETRNALKEALASALASSTSEKGELANKEAKSLESLSSPSAESLPNLNSTSAIGSISSLSGSLSDSPASLNSTSLSEFSSDRSTWCAESPHDSNKSQPSPISSRLASSSPEISNISISSSHDSISSFSEPSTRDIGIQVRPRFRSKVVQTVPPRPMVSCATSPFKKKNVRIDKDREEQAFEEDPKEDFGNALSTHDSSFRLDTSTCLDTSFCPSECDDQDEKAKKTVSTHLLKIMEGKCRRYLGVDSHNMFVIPLLQKYTGYTKEQIMMVLRKVKLNEPNDILGDWFSMSETSVAKSIISALPCVSSLLQTYIIWPEKDIIRTNLPISFRANYSKVESIIDCFEVEIEKPSNATHQALTWSDYKKCNTLKYLISCTPDGLINFISKGYGGRASDVEIVKDCGYLEKLRPCTVVMADRGFKQIETLLLGKQCSLVRPPSVSADKKMTEAEVRQTKVIASLRIHVERVIKRVREYEFLAAHSRFHHSLIDVVDDVTIIACALSNLQGSLIKR